MVLTAWPKKDLELLRDATIQFLNARAGDTVLDPVGNDRSDYMNILEALRKHVQANDLYWDVRQVPTKMRFEDWENNVNHESWEDKNKRK